MRAFTLKIQPPLLRQPNLLHSQTGCRIVMRSACTLKTQPPLLGTQLTNTHKHISGSINSASQKQHKLLRQSNKIKITNKQRLHTNEQLLLIRCQLLLFLPSTKGLCITFDFEINCFYSLMSEETGHKTTYFRVSVRKCLNKEFFEFSNNPKSGP